MKSLYELVEEFLKSEQSKKFTSKEIATKIYERNRKSYEIKRQSFSTDDLFYRQLAAEISRDKDKLMNITGIYIDESNIPYIYYYSDEKHKNSVESKRTQQKDSQEGKELELYPKLADFLKSHFDILSKRIDDKTSKNTGGKNWNKWLHPDLVGIKILDRKWSDNIKKCYKEAGNNNLEFFSYEVKIELAPHTLRESFFQTVSNSSWANYGYLVTSQFRGNNILPEIEVLSKTHGIGIIQLNIENPPESKVLFPARYRKNIAWGIIDRVSGENKDFKQFIQSVGDYYSLGRTDPRDWYSEKDWEIT